MTIDEFILARLAEREAGASNQATCHRHTTKEDSAVRTTLTHDHLAPMKAAGRLR